MMGKRDESRSERILIQPDARGRIQLPQELRGFDIFELNPFVGEQGETSHVLRGITLPQKNYETKNSRWLRDETQNFLKKTLFPKIVDFCNCQKIFNSISFLLFGSQAREEASTQSDFDFAVLLEKTPSFKERHSFTEEFEKFLRVEKKTLEQHKITGEFSLVFLNVYANVYPPLYFSVAQEGKLIFDQDSLSSTFSKVISEKSKSTDMKKITIAGLSTWGWDSKKVKT